MHFSGLNLWRSPIARLLFLILCFCPLATSAHAQTFSSITGTVTDTSGAVIPGAKVTVENTATHVVSQTITNGAGSYVSADVLPGNYVVTVEKAGFQTHIISPVNVDVSGQTRADAQLSPGSTLETVKVAAPDTALDTTQPQLGTVIEIGWRMAFSIC